MIIIFGIIYFMDFVFFSRSVYKHFLFFRVFRLNARLNLLHFARHVKIASTPRPSLKHIRLNTPFNFSLPSNPRFFEWSLSSIFWNKILYEYCMFPIFCQIFTHSEDLWQTACITNFSLREILQPPFNCLRTSSSAACF